MYKVMLVDDEKLILQGVHSIIEYVQNSIISNPVLGIIGSSGRVIREELNKTSYINKLLSIE